MKLYDTTLHAKGGLPEQDFFRTADAAVCFYDITKQASYDALEAWYDAVQKHNARKGSEPLPVCCLPATLVTAHVMYITYTSFHHNHKVK